MDQEKVYHPQEIEDSPLPGGESEPTTNQATGSDTYRPQTIKPQNFPARRIAVELIGAALNTRSRRILGEFQFTESGALQIGKYVNGVSGDVRISPDGIVARDSAGLTTFALDGTNGSAVFKGSIQSGSLITGEVVVGDNNVIIDGENKRIIVNDGTTDRVLIGQF